MQTCGTERSVIVHNRKNMATSRYMTLRRLEVKFRRELHKSRGGGLDHLPESRVADVAVYRIRSIELGVIEYVECLQSELDRFGLVQLQYLRKSHIEVFDTRSIKEPTC